MPSDPLLPSDAGWNGWLDPEEVPRVADPASGRLRSANQRAVGDAKTVTVALRNGTLLTARVVESNAALDLAILSTRYITEAWLPLVPGITDRTPSGGSGAGRSSRTSCGWPRS